MNPDLEALLLQTWTARRRPVGDLVQILVEAADGAPVCTAAVVCGETRADAFGAALARALAALPALVGALRQLAELRDNGNGPAVRVLSQDVRDVARAALTALEADES